jgi:hypothetical protein
VNVASKVLYGCRFAVLVAGTLFACGVGDSMEKASGSQALAFPSWDGDESVADYARRANLAPTLALDLGSGVMLETILIPAGRFTMGTRGPDTYQRQSIESQIWLGGALLAASLGSFVAFVFVVVFRAVRRRQRPSYSLAQLILLTLALGVGVLGVMHWWSSSNKLAALEDAERRFWVATRCEMPAHDVIITSPFYMGKYEVTWEQYSSLSGNSYDKGKSQYPVGSVSWPEAQAFCIKASERIGRQVRLPTEAEWEYACRAGTTTRFCSGDADEALDVVGWYRGNAGKTTHPVGQKTPNRWGLHDMHGNVFEWCADWERPYSLGELKDPRGPEWAFNRSARGGSWGNNPMGCTSAFRMGKGPDEKFDDLGFRVVVEVVAGQRPAPPPKSE